MTTELPVDRDLALVLSSCTVRRPWAEQDEGPYHRPAQPVRRDVTEDREGMSLQLGIRLANEDETPREGAIVEIWHCDAVGRYSGFPPPTATTATSDTAPHGAYLPNQTFLRGRQATDAAGMVEFHTIYPGWYPGRTVHVHLMAHTDGEVFTSQLYFPDDVTDAVLAVEPYVRRPGRDTANDLDELISTGGEPALLDISPTGDGLRAAVCLVLPGVDDSQ